MKEKKFYSRFLLVVGISLVLSISLGAAKTKKKSQDLFTESVIDRLQWRCIGPANMGGRIDDFAVVENTHLF